MKHRFHEQERAARRDTLFQARFAISIACAGLLLVGAEKPSKPPKKPVKPAARQAASMEQERTALQGSWWYSSGTLDGKPLAGPSASYKLNFNGDRLLVALDPELEIDSHSTFEIDMAQKPRQIVIGVDGPKYTTYKRHLIYERSGDTLKIAFAGTNEDDVVPQNFSAKGEKHKATLVFKRQRPTSKTASVAGDLEPMLCYVDIVKPMRLPKGKKGDMDEDGDREPFELGWVIVNPRKNLCGSNRKKTVVDACTDDTGASLLSQRGDQQIAKCGIFVSGGRLDSNFTAELPLGPRPGARQVHFEASLCVLLGRGETTIDAKAVPLGAEAEVALPGRTLKINSAVETFADSEGHVTRRVIIFGPAELGVRKIEFLDPQGAVLMAPVPNAGYDSHCELPTAAKTVDLRLEIFESVDEVIVPVVVDIGLGY